jgi:hypothetical protein
MDEKGDLLADSHNILNKFKRFLSHLLNVHGVSHVRQLEVVYSSFHIMWEII